RGREVCHPRGRAHRRCWHLRQGREIVGTSHCAHFAIWVCSSLSNFVSEMKCRGIRKGCPAQTSKSKRQITSAYQEKKMASKGKENRIVTTMACTVCRQRNY